MRAIKITAVDIGEVTGYSRNQVRGLLDELAMYSEQETSPRVAREFTRLDLIVLAVIHLLEARVGIRRKTVSAIVGPLRKALAGPKTINRDARLLISTDPATVNYVAIGGTAAQDGILISLGPIFERVDKHLNYGLPYAVNNGPELNIGPGLISSKAKKVAKR